jgi:hypothetical protein
LNIKDRGCDGDHQIGSATASSQGAWANVGASIIIA